MCLTFIYSAETSRQERLNYLAYAIEKQRGRSLAFQSLDKKDRITFLALCKITSSSVNWSKIGNKTLRNAVQELLHGPKLFNLLQLPPKEMTRAHLPPFLTGKDLANLQSTHKAAPELGNASLIIKNYDLVLVIAKYCHQDCEILNEGGKSKALHQLISMVQELSEVEELESPSYQSIRQFFELVEARNLLRMADRMNEIHPLAGLENKQLQITEDSAATLQRAEKVRAWFGQHQADLQAFVELNLQMSELTLLPPEIGQLRALTHLWVSTNYLTSLPKEIGQLRALTHLWVNNNYLASLPKEIGQLRALNELNLPNNHLRSLPKEIGQLDALTEFDLTHNHLTSLPKEIGQLGALTSLDLANNRLISLPKEIWQLGALTSIDLANNRLISLPKEVGLLRALTYLWLNDNHLASLPKEVGLLGALRTLYLNNNHLTSVPKEIGQLKALTILWIDNNRLTSVPKEFGQLKALTHLGLHKNQLTSLPKEFGQLAALTSLWLNNNRLRRLPKEIGQLQALNGNSNFQMNGFIDLPIGLERFSVQLEKQNKTLQMKTFLSQLKRCLKGKHDCRAILALLNTLEKILGKEIGSLLHRSIYEVCKGEKSLLKKLKSSQFGRKAFVDPKINPKFKLVVIKQFEEILQEVLTKHF